MRRVAGLSLVLACVAGCSREPDDARGRAPAAESRSSKAFPGGFVDVAKESGLDFAPFNGVWPTQAWNRTVDDPLKQLPQTMGSGCAFLDYDSDGILDVWLVGGNTCELFRGRPAGKFQFAYEPASGFSHGMGVAIGDYDGDGDDDAYVTAVDRCALLRNDRGIFVDATGRAGVGGGTWKDQKGAQHPAWSTAALWCDYDLDGDLDLFVAGYVEWTEETEIFTTLDGVTKGFTTPDRYTGLPVRLYQNRGDGTFDDVTARSGLMPHLGKGLGIATWDLDHDGYPDVVVANDTRPNFVFMSQKNGRFEERGLAMRIAYDENGRARAGMGIDIADYANDGVPGIAIGNFAGEPMSLYRADGKGAFLSVAEKAGLGPATTPLLTFGLAFADLDLDGIQDLVLVNGHIEPDIARVQPEQSHAQKALLFLGVPGGSFVDASASAGADFQKPRVGRGLAVADYDQDGDLDLLVTQNGGPAALLQNRLIETAPSHWLRVVLKGAGRNTRALGATVTLRAGGSTQTRVVRTGGSYLSQGDVFPTFGLGAATKIDELRVRWPGGAERTYPVDRIDCTMTVGE